MQALVSQVTEERFVATLKLVEALERYPEGKGKPNESAFTLSFGKSLFKRKVAMPDAMQWFGQVMSAWSEGDGSAHMRNGYEWGKLGAGTVVDAGGARATLRLQLPISFLT